MRAAQKRGYAVWVCEQRALHWREGRVAAAAQRISLADDDEDWYRSHETELRPLERFAATLMRKDPPFDLEYIVSTWLLSAAVRQGARVFNAPDAIRDHNEKMAISEFARFTVPTLVSREPERIQAFIDEQRDVVVKRLDVMGGEHVFRVRPDDPNRNVIVETISQRGARTVMAQRFIPEIKDGDKRVILIGGKLVPHCLARIPKPGPAATLPRARAGSRSRSARAIARSAKRWGRCWRPGPAAGRAGRDRRLPHRGQRHQSDGFQGNPGPDRL